MRDFSGYVICDLDGCLSDDRWRRAALPASPTRPEDFDHYHSMCHDDEMVRDTFNAIMYDAHDEDDEQQSLLLFVTARPDRHSFREMTTRWLEKHMGSVEFVLLMRPSESTESSTTLKIRLINEFFEALHGSPLSGWDRVVGAYDDRSDVLDSYPIPYDRKHRTTLVEAEPRRDGSSVPEILTTMAETFRERNAVYADNYLRVAPIISILWPEGVPSALVTEDRWHLFELMIVKLTRFAISDLTHTDSIHDAAVYAAMIESDIRRNA